jgi:4,5-DOPA dioxygenase extradiol
MTERFPAFFISHGAPSLALDNADPTNRFLQQLGAQLGKPRAVLVVSAHWETRAPRVGSTIAPDTIHDFHGFPEQLYRMSYPAPGAPELALRVLWLLKRSGIEADIDRTRGVDHGAWIPLMLMYPQADVPVTQLSVQIDGGSDHHYAIGKALRPLRDAGVLIIGSGGLTHNLSELDRGAHAKTMPLWAAEFRAWTVAAIEQGRHDDLLRYRRLAPNAARNHPSEEHFLPLFPVLGAAGAGKRVHADVAFRSLAMDAFRFD